MKLESELGKHTQIHRSAANNALHLTALCARKSAAQPASWLVWWRRYSPRIRAAGERNRWVA